MKKTFLIFFGVTAVTVIGSCGSYWLFSEQILQQVTEVTAIAFPLLVGFATGLLVGRRSMWLYCLLGLAVGAADFVGTGLIEGSFPTATDWLPVLGIFFVGQPLMFLVSAMVGGWIQRYYYRSHTHSALPSRVAAAPSRPETSRQEDGAKDSGVSETQPKVQPETPRTPVFMFIAIVGFVASLFTPTMYVVFPILGTIAFAVISLFRRERAYVVSGVVLIATIGLLILSSNPIRAVEIASWNWRTDLPQAGMKGFNIWNVQVRNVSRRYVRSVLLELTTYDEGGAIVKSESGYIWRAIAPGQTRTEEKFTDYVGIEKSAALKVTRVDIGSPRLSQ